MSPRPLIYVSRITNLSDARYCAGMGADMLGFVIDPADPDFVSATTFRELIGWVSGPARVAECGAANVNEADYSPDYLHVMLDQLAFRPASSVRLIVEVQFQKTQTLSTDIRSREDIAYWLVTDVPDNLTAPMQLGAPVLIARNQFPGSIADYLLQVGAAGLALRGSSEASPGLKDYDHLAIVLEELDR